LAVAISSYHLLS